jgi:hypothetical protein
MEQKRSIGYAHRFRPTYAVANVGHPSDFLSRYGVKRKPQISPLRCAPVEMTILFEDRILRLHEKHEILAATELSSRPERSVVERSAVFSFGSHTPSLVLVCGRYVLEKRAY